MASVERVRLGRNVVLREPCNLFGCEIGDNTSVGAFAEIGRGVKVGRNCKIGAFAFVPEGVVIEDEVFVGPHACFTNDKLPRAAREGRLLRRGEWKLEKTLVRKGASIGANATILCGTTIGERAIVGAGAVVTEDVPGHKIVAGNPARVIGVVRKRRN